MVGCRGVVRGRGRVVGLSLGVLRHSLVGDISDITVVVVSSVFDVLGSAIGKGNAVRSSDGTVAICVLGSVEVGLGVVIRDSIFESIGCRLLFVGRGSMVSGFGSGMVGSRSRVVRSRSGMIGSGMVDGSNMGYMVDGSNMGNMVDGCMMRNVAGVSNNRSVTVANAGVRADIWGSTGQTNESRNDKSLHDCSI